MADGTGGSVASAALAAQTTIPVAMIGGGAGAFIGAVHRAAMGLDGRFCLVAGAFSSDPARSRAAAVDLGLDPARGYRDVASLLEGEAARPDGARAAVIVTPNHLHKDQVIAAAKAGLAIFCEKPLALSLSEALEMQAAVAQGGQPFVVAHAYSAYPMVEQARLLVASGALGIIRRADAAYLQGWLADPIERDGQKQAAWRTDPAQAGGGASGDIATHAHHLLEHVTGLRLARLAARLSTLVPGRQIDDDVSMLGELANGARVTLSASQIAIGRANGLTLSVYGDKAALEWNQEQPGVLWFRPHGAPEQRWTEGAGTGWLDAPARDLSRTPAGHPGGLIEAFGNLYRSFADQIDGRAPSGFVAPGIEEAVRGMAFLQAVQVSSNNNSAWTDVA